MDGFAVGSLLGATLGEFDPDIVGSPLGLIEGVDVG
jgi:hypothetical protein